MVADKFAVLFGLLRMQCPAKFQSTPDRKINHLSQIRTEGIKLCSGLVPEGKQTF